MWKKAVFVFSVLLLSVLLGCRTKTSSTKTLRMSVYTSDPQIIRILNETLRELEKELGFPVELLNIPYGDYQNKITTMMAGGNAPDVISVEVNNFTDLYLRGVLEDLTPYFENDGLKREDYYAAIMKRFSPDGKIYAVPSDIAPFGLVYYNKKIFLEAGVPFPRGDWSWPEPFLSICKRLVKKNAEGRTVRWAYGDPYNITADNFLLSNGGYFTDREENPNRLALDSPQAVQAYRFRWDLIHTHGVSPTPEQVQAYNFGSGAETMFANGQIAMMASGLWHTPNFLTRPELEFDVVEFPRGPKGLRGYGCGGAGYAVWKKSPRKKEAWRLVRVFTGPEVSKKLAATGLMQPALISAAESEAFLKSAGPPGKSVLLAMPKFARFAPFLKGWPEIWHGFVGPALDRVWLGTKTPEEALPEITREVNRRFFQ